MSDPLVLHFVTLYVLSIIVRYRPRLWREITEGGHTDYFPLLRSYLSVVDRVVPELALERILGRNVVAIQPGSFNAPFERDGSDRSAPVDADDDRCWGPGVDAPACGAAIVCSICETCAAHCLTPGGPDACWGAHESWRLGGPDPTFGEVTASSKPPTGSIPPAPKPRWRS